MSQLPPERRPKPFLKSRTFAALEGGADAPIGTLVRKSLAASEQLDTVRVSLKTISSLQSPVVTSLPSTLQKVVEEKIQRLNRIFDKLGESGDDVVLRFLPGDLVPELSALIEEKEYQLSLVLRSLQGGANLPLCEDYLRGQCTNGVTCSFSHDHGRLLTYIKRWVAAELRVPVDERGEPIEGSYGYTVESASSSSPNTARLGATIPLLTPQQAFALPGTDPSDLPSVNNGTMGPSRPSSVLTINEPFGPEAWDLLLRQLPDYPNVHSLVLRQMIPSGIKRLTDMLRRNELDRTYHVDLSRNGIGQTYPQGVLKLAKALLYNTSVVSLDVAFNKLGAAGVLALTQSIGDGSAIEAVNFSTNGLNPSDPAYGQFCSLLAKGNLNLLRKLSLAGNSLGGEGSSALLDSLASSDYANLTHLDLYHVGLGDRGCKALSEFLTSERSSGPNVRLLNVGWNGITSQGVQMLCQSLVGHNELQILHLHGNSQMGRKGAIALSQLLKNAQHMPLRILDLRWTTPTDDGVASIAEAITYSKYLEKVILQFNDLDSRSEALVAEKLKKRPHLLAVDEGVRVSADDEVW